MENSIKKHLFLCIFATLFILGISFYFEESNHEVYASTPAEKDVKAWSEKELAAQMLMLGTGSEASKRVGEFTKKGIGGICLQNPIPKKLNAQIKQANTTAPRNVLPIIASDEEGGKVQRFRKTIYPMPSARKMGRYSDKKITSITSAYAKQLTKYGVNAVLGPVVDLQVKGRYIASLDRAFAKNPKQVWRKSTAWSKGFEKSGIIVTYKHWPGKGSAKNTHTQSSKVYKLSILEKRDMYPFNKKFKEGCEMVMVGHVNVPGLTEKKTPATLSKKAYAYLRGKAGGDTVIITDSLSMDASSSAIGLSLVQAAVKALRSGADIALSTSGNADSYVNAVAKAISSGEIPRAQAEASVSRILRLKEKHGLA